MHECPLKLAYLLGFKSCMWMYPYFHWLICLYLICDIYVKLVDWLFIRTKLYFTWKKSEQNFFYKWWITWNKINTAVLLDNLPKASLNSIFHWLNGHEFEQTLKIVKDRETWSAAVHGIAKSQTWLSNWATRLIWFLKIWWLSGQFLYLPVYQHDFLGQFFFFFLHCLNSSGLKTKTYGHPTQIIVLFEFILHYVFMPLIVYFR